MPLPYTRRQTEFQPHSAPVKPALSDAWLGASLTIDNAVAVAEMLWQAMSDNDMREFESDGVGAYLGALAEQHRRVLSAIQPMLQDVSAFFERYEGEMSSLGKHQAQASVAAPIDDELLHGKISNELHAALDAFKWALDAMDEACATQDSKDHRYDNSKAARRRFQDAERRHLETERALVEYQPKNLSELRLKARTICDLRRQEILGEEMLDAVIASFVEFGKVANG